MKKKFLSIILALLVMTSMSVVAFADEGSDNLSNGTSSVVNEEGYNNNENAGINEEDGDNNQEDQLNQTADNL